MGEPMLYGIAAAATCQNCDHTLLPAFNGTLARSNFADLFDHYWATTRVVHSINTVVIESAAGRIRVTGAECHSHV